MEHTEILVFLPPEQLQEKVKGIFEKERQIIKKHFPDVDVQNVGSTAIPGAMGKFDIDIQIRVTQEQFSDVMDWMREGCFAAKNTDCWTEQYGLFRNEENYIDYNVTVIDSKHDIFHHIRDYLIEHPAVLQKYMELKMSFQGKTYGDYRSVRHKFFQRIRKRIRKLKNLSQ